MNKKEQTQIINNLGKQLKRDFEKCFNGNITLQELKNQVITIKKVLNAYFTNKSYWSMSLNNNDFNLCYNVDIMNHSRCNDSYKIVIKANCKKYNQIYILTPIMALDYYKGVFDIDFITTDANEVSHIIEVTEFKNSLYNINYIQEFLENDIKLNSYFKHNYLSNDFINRLKNSKLTLKDIIYNKKVYFIKGSNNFIQVSKYDYLVNELIRD